MGQDAGLMAGDREIKKIRRRREPWRRAWVVDAGGGVGVELMLLQQEAPDGMIGRGLGAVGASRDAWLRARGEG